MQIALGPVMHTNIANDNPGTGTVVRIKDRYLDRIEAAEYIRETLGIPIHHFDLELYAKSKTGPTYRKWGRKPLYKPSDLVAWANSRLSEPIHPAGRAG